jgi:hypothetical protein
MTISSGNPVSGGELVEARARPRAADEGLRLAEMQIAPEEGHRRLWKADGERR